MWPYLEATERDRANWLELFKSPFDPYVEFIEQAGQGFFLLKSNSLSDLTDSLQVCGAGKLLVRQMNSIVVEMIGKSEVGVSGTCQIRDGRLVRNYHLEAETAHFRFGMGSARIQVFDSSGKLIESPPEPTTAQKRIKTALANKAIGDALLYCGSDPDWFDLYKAFECLRDAELLGADPTKSFTQTATMFRHRKGRYDEPEKPMSLPEARSLLRRWISEAADKLATPLGPG